MAFITISKPAVGEPTTKDLEDNIIDNQVFLNNSIAASIGGLIINFSFETDADSDGEADGWDYTNYSGGSNALEQSNESGGVNSQSFTSTVAANGGAYIDSLDYFEVGGDEIYRFSVWRHASGADISCQYQVTWYDDSKSSISTSTVFQDTDTPTSRTLSGGSIQAPTTARYAKIRLEGGVPGVSSGTGTIYFDRVYCDRISTGWQTRSITEFSSDSNIELDISNNNQHLIIFSGVFPSGNNSTLVCEVSQDNGSTWKTGASNYRYARTNMVGTTETFSVDTVANSIVMTNDVIDSGGAGWSLEVRVFQHSNGRCQFQWNISGGDLVPDSYRVFGAGFLTLNTDPITNIRFDIGTFVSGNCTHMAAN